MRLGTKAKHDIRAMWPDKASTIERLVDGTLSPETFKSVQEWLRTCYNRPSQTELILHAFNEVIEGYGVEALGEVDMHDGPPFEYINQGDTYDTTLVYNHRKGTLFVSSWGDVAERNRL